MRTFQTTGIAFLLICLLASHAVSAQDYSIYTRISHQSDTSAESKPTVISRSLTLWHAGKAYDWIEQVGELVIYDPSARRYTILSGPHQKACTVEFSEVRNYLKVARTKARDYLEDLSRADEPGAKREINRTRFQLDPQFTIGEKPEEGKIRFAAPEMEYVVEVVDAPNADIAAAFSDYADWASQLNYVLHGQSLLPGPRMIVNEELKKRNLLPVKVQLHLKDGKGTILTAEHTIQWDLGSSDRSRIRDWQSLLQNEQFEFVSFQEYQRRLLSSE